MKKRMSALLLALVLCLSISAPAFATEIAQSKPISVSGNGRNYDIWATLYEDRGRYSGAAWVESSNGSAFPVDQIRAWAYVEDGAGNMVESTVGTLSSPYYFLVVQTKYAFFPGTEMESYGLIDVKQSSGKYNTEETLHATASVSSRSLLSDKKSSTLSVNSQGETYGSLSTAIATGKDLDLIAAIGTEGQRGYIRYNDMMADDENIFDPRYGGKKIPLYDLDGQRIGSFFIEFSHLDFTGKDIETVKAELADSTAQNPKLWTLADEFLVDGKYPVNAKGQTYGPRILREAVGYSPDLIPAVSAEENNGVAGYIRCRKELPVSEEEMAALCAATSEPLYDVDGNVIGTFEWKSEPVHFVGKTIPDVQSELAERPVNEVSSDAIEASDAIQPRDAVLFYRQNVTSTDGNVIASIELGVDTRKNEIIDIHRLLGIERVNSDYYTTQLSGAEIISEQYSLDRTSVEFRIQFYAKTVNDPVVGLHYANFKTSI